MKIVPMVQMMNKIYLRPQFSRLTVGLHTAIKLDRAKKRNAVEAALHVHVTGMNNAMQIL
jgi:hypothetical protein